MPRLTVPAAISLLVIAAVFHSPLTVAGLLARMSVSIVATGTDATQSQGEWSKGTFSYRVGFTTILETDGEASNLNMYDPDFARKSMAAATANLAKIQAAMNGQFSESEEAAEPEDRYLLYLGQTGCTATLSIDISEALEGAYADVGGMQPYTVTFTAKSDGTAQDLTMLCVANSGVLDIKDNVLYRSTLNIPEVTGHFLLREKNRGNIIDDPLSQRIALPTIVSDYAFKILRVAPARGRAEATLTPTEPVLSRSGPAGGYSGSVDVEMTWDFEPLNK